MIQHRLDWFRRFHATLLVAILGLFLFGIGSNTAAARQLVTEAEARRLGLERAWNAQVRLDPARNEVERAVLEGDRLTVLTTACVVQEFDALTGRTLWVAPIGNPDHPSLGPAASDAYIALINGSTLYVLDRKDGKPVKVRPVGGAPGASPAVGQKYVFVPLAMGRIEAYPINEKLLTPWYYQSFGRAMVKPLATPESFVWTTDTGHFYVGRAEDLGVRFRLETGSEIVAPPAYGAPNVIAATSDGDVFSMHEVTGQRNWKYPTGFSVERAPAVVGKRVFVTSGEPTLHCIDADTGAGLWEAPNVAQFAAASAKRVYGVDDLGAFLVLDASTGALLGRMPSHSSANALVNDQTDRVYLVSPDGVVQCFHEIGAKKPIYHRPKPEDEKPATPPSDAQPAKRATAPPAESAEEEEATEEGGMFDEEPAEEPAEEEVQPADEMEDAEAPAEDAGLDEDPFAEMEGTE
jgi:outer membrane protein assembly factor BamB